MKRYLIYKLLAINLLVIGFAMVIIWIAIDVLAAGYFVTLMEKYNISPKPAHAMFVHSVHRYMIWASVAAVFLAAALSFSLTRRALIPLVNMSAIAAKIGAGQFNVKVPVTSSDEVGQLAVAFNRMAKDLETLEMLRKNLMIDVAHELRTPLTNIRGYLEALEDGVLPPSYENIALLQNEAARLNRLVEDVLDLARADAAYNRLVLEKSDLARLVKTITETVFAGPAGHDRYLEISGADAPLWITMDEKRMARVIRNLADNAATYSPKGTCISVVVEKGPTSVRTTFSNTAKELAREDLPYLFERFYRGEKSRSRDHGGAGIGLSIVKELVGAHGGTVTADLDGHTLRIRLELPIAPPPS